MSSLTQLENWADNLYAENPHGIGANLRAYASAWRTEMAALQQRIAELTAERDRLRALLPPMNAGAVYRHYNGCLYEYICDGHLEWFPDEHVIVYRAMSDGRVWIRPRNQFFGLTLNGERRFEKIAESREALESGKS